MPEINTLPKPEAAIATGISPVEQPYQPKVESYVMDGPLRTVNVSDRDPMMTEEDVYWNYGVHMGRLMGTYKLPYTPEHGSEADHTIFIFDDSNPKKAKHASPDKQYTIISQRALEAMSKSRLESRKEEFDHRDIIQIGEGQQLDVGRGHRWLPKEAKAALKGEKRRAMSDNQAEFYVENGELILKATGYNSGVFTGMQSKRERAIKEQKQEENRVRQMAIRAGRAAREIEERSRASSNAPTGRVLESYEGNVATGSYDPAETTPKRHRVIGHLAALLRSRRKASTSTASHDLNGGLNHRTRRRQDKRLNKSML